MDDQRKDIEQRWAFPGHYFADYTEQQVEDVRYLLAEVKRLREAIKTHKVERDDNLPNHKPDDFDAKLYEVLNDER